MGVVVLLVVAISVLMGTAVVARRQRTRGLLRMAGRSAAPMSESTRPMQGGLLRVWLLRAGYGQTGAASLYALSTGVALALGAILVWVSRGLVDDAALTVGEVPGGVGEMLVSALRILPFAGGLLCAIIPTLFVRAARRARVAAVDHDLPLVLELLATSAEAGLSFDAALARVVDVQPPGRPLTLELRSFQRDVLSGSPRLQALRQLAWRVDVTSLTVFVAAVIQSEQIGSSMAETLRIQADDLRARRREQALLLAQALPVKLVFPLLICFLPGIFLSTLGPVLYQMIRVADSVLRPLAR